jgi:hypothetical protein
MGLRAIGWVAGSVLLAVGCDSKGGRLGTVTETSAVAACSVSGVTGAGWAGLGGRATLASVRSFAREELHGKFHGVRIAGLTLLVKAAQGVAQGSLASALRCHFAARDLDTATGKVETILESTEQGVEVTLTGEEPDVAGALSRLMQALAPPSRAP